MSTGQNIPFPNSSGPHHPAADDLVLYAMELLSADEAAPIARHLQSCAECREELTRIYGDLTLVAATSELQPAPDAARQRLLQQVSREKKIVPTPLAEQPAARHSGLQAESHPPIAAFGRTASILSIEDRPPRRTGRVILAVAGWAVAAGLAVAVVLDHKNADDLRSNLAAQSGQIQRLDTDAASSHQLMDALTDPKAVRVTLSPKPQPSAQPIGNVTYNPSRGSLVFLASNMDPLQAYKTYELWVIPADGGAPVPAGTFHPDDEGNASVIMPDLPKGIAAKAFGITIEASGGAQTPTLPIIMSGS